MAPGLRSEHTHGDHEGKSFRILAVPSAPLYTVCYWRGDRDKSTRKCVTVQDGDAVTYVGMEVVKTVG